MINASPRTGPIRETIVGTGWHSEEPDNEFTVCAMFAYGHETPYSIHATISTNMDSADGCTSWELSRELLTEALTTRRLVGIGDLEAVVITPETLMLRLWDPGYGRLGVHFDMHLPRQRVHRFIAATTRIVPVGAESDHLNIDNALERLFA